MSNRIYVHSYLDKAERELDADESIVFERDGIRTRIYWHPDGIRVSCDEAVVISPEASNVFTVRPTTDVRTRGAARRVRRALLASKNPDDADVRLLVEAAL